MTITLFLIPHFESPNKWFGTQWFHETGIALKINYVRNTTDD